MPKVSKITDLRKAWNKQKARKSYQKNAYVKAKSFLIVCEGANTEPLYFKSFPVLTAKVKTCGGYGQRISVVKYAMKLAKDPIHRDHEIWCVFDLDFTKSDPNSKQQFNQAIQLAENQNFNIAYSNDAFELWLLLHYQHFDAKSLRFDYYKILSNRWKLNYEKKGKKHSFCRSLYQKLEDDEEADQNLAIKRAEKLHEKYQVNDIHFSERNPCTTVYRLVLELNKYLKQ